MKRKSWFKFVCVLAFVFVAVTHARGQVLGLVLGDQVVYLSGTKPSPKAGTRGTFEVTDPNALVFASGGETLRIGYSQMEQIDYRVELAHHLGVLPTIAVGLVARRHKRHLLDITYTDASGTSEVAHFEVARRVPEQIFPVVRARAAQACSGKSAPERCQVQSGGGW